jgi:hypothetical protein
MSKRRQFQAPEVSSTCGRLRCFDASGTSISSVAKKQVDCTRYSTNQKGYVQIKTSYGSAENTNEKVQLQQLLLWFHPDEQHRAFARNSLMAAPPGEKLEAAHLCNFKLCTNPVHIWLEPGSTNKSRNYCPVWTTIDDKWYFTCDHQPQCIYTSRSKVVRLQGVKAIPQAAPSL